MAPEPLIALPRVESVMQTWSGVTLTLRDGRAVIVPFSYAKALDEATPELRDWVVVTQSGMLVSWPDLGYSVTLRRLLLDARAEHSPWGDPPEVRP